MPPVQSWRSQTITNEAPVSFGFPAHNDVGLIHLVDNPIAPGRRILLAFGYHRTGSAAAVSSLVAAGRGFGLPELATSSYLVVERSPNGEVMCLERGVR